MRRIGSRRLYSDLESQLSREVKKMAAQHIVSRGIHDLVKGARHVRRKRKNRAMSCELLEPRLALAADLQTVGFDVGTRTQVFEAMPAEEASSAETTGVGRQEGSPGIYVPGGPIDDSQPETVHGNDDRIQVGNTTTFPWRAIVKLEMTYPSGNRYICSGAMISPYHALTAGHCVYDHDEDDWADSVDVSPGMDGEDNSDGDSNGRFYGTASAIHFRTYTAWTQNEDANHDWALLTLDRRVGNTTGWLGYEWRSDDDDFDGMSVNTAGYPGDLDFGERMYRAFGQTDHATALKLYYSGNTGLDTAGGQSGSSVWRFDSAADSRYVVAVHAYGGTTLNSGTRITNGKFDDLQRWIGDDDTLRPPTDLADLVDYDEWFNTSVALVNDTSVEVGELLSGGVRVRNNGTANASNFTARFRLSTDSQYDTSDVLLDDVTVSNLSPFNSSQISFSANVPNLPAGSYYVVWTADAFNDVTEFSGQNNTGFISPRVTVSVPVVNTAPVLALAGSISYLENAPPKVLAAPAVLTDNDSPNFAGGELRVRIAQNASTSDRLTIRNQGTGTGQIGVSGQNVTFAGQTIGTFRGGVGQTALIVSLNSNATVPATQALIRNVLFRTLGDNPSVARRRVVFIVRDGDGGTSQGRSRLVNVVAVNDAPRITNVGSSLNYEANDPAIALLSTAVVADPDSANFAAGRLTVHYTQGRHSSNRLLVGGAFTLSGNNILLGGTRIGSRNVNGGIGASNLIITFTSDATRQVVQQLLRSIRFRTVGATTAVQRAITFTLTDGDGGTSNVASKIVRVTL